MANLRCAQDFPHRPFKTEIKVEGDGRRARLRFNHLLLVAANQVADLMIASSAAQHRSRVARLSNGTKRMHRNQQKMLQRVGFGRTPIARWPGHHGK